MVMMEIGDLIGVVGKQAGGFDPRKGLPVELDVAGDIIIRRARRLLHHIGERPAGVIHVITGNDRAVCLFGNRLNSPPHIRVDMTIIAVRAVFVARQPGRSITGIIGHLDPADLGDVAARVIFDVAGARLAAIHGFNNSVACGVVGQINLAIAEGLGEEIAKGIILECA